MRVWVALANLVLELSSKQATALTVAATADAMQRHHVRRCATLTKDMERRAQLTWEIRSAPRQKGTYLWVAILCGLHTCS